MSDNENILTFMYQSIADTQSVIRSIDTKLGFILVLNLIPVANIGKIYSKVYASICNECDCWMFLLKIVMLIICIICWIVGCWCTYRGISAIDNPKDHVKDAHDVSGYFYSGNLYRTNFLDALCNRKGLKSEVDLFQYIKDKPNTDIDILKELSFEKMKLAYVRNVKLIRQSYSFKFSVAWVVLGIIIYLL